MLYLCSQIETARYLPVDNRMKRIGYIWLFLAVSGTMVAGTLYSDSCKMSVTGNDTLYVAYRRTVRDVKKCLPYAKMITADMAYADAELAKLPDNKARRKWWRAYERKLFKKYEKDFRNMYPSQGMMLMKLMDRETDRTSYELIKQYKGKVAANFWQFIAKLFRNDLKEEYDASDKDRITERVINLVEAGQL